MKKQYENPELELIIMDNISVVCASVQDVLDPNNPIPDEPGVNF